MTDRTHTTDSPKAAFTAASGVVSARGMWVAAQHGGADSATVLNRKSFVLAERCVR